MQTAKLVYFRIYAGFVVVSAAYSLMQVMNTHQRGWLGALLTSWPIAAFFLRMFTDPTPRTASKLIPIHMLAAVGLLITFTSEPSIEQIACVVAGFIGLLIYDFWAGATEPKTE